MLSKLKTYLHNPTQRQLNLAQVKVRKHWKKTSSYEDKLSKLNLTTLEVRRWRGDMIQTWRIMSGKDMVKVETWFDMEMDRQRVGATTTRHNTQHHAIRPRTYHYEERGKFFSNRFVQEYNSLSSFVKQAKDINEFKNNLDKYRGTPSRTVSKPTQTQLARASRNRGSS